MNNSANSVKSKGYTVKLADIIKKIFHNILQDSRKVINAISTKTPEAVNLLELQAQKIGSIEGKISSVLQLQTLEHDEFGHTRETVDVCEDISLIVNNLQKITTHKKTIIETRFPKEKPSVKLNKSLFQKWIRWCITKIYQEKPVLHVFIDVLYQNNEVAVRISPKRVSGSLEISWKSIDWLLANRYFELESSNLVEQQDQGVEIVMPAVIQYAIQISGHTDEGKIDILQKISEGGDLPTLSPIAVKIINLAADETSSAKDIAGVITLDPALTARLLKVVNSPFYGFANEISSIPQAVAILGMKAVRTLSLCISILETFPLDGESKFDYQDFWQRSFASAVSCKLTAQKLGLHIEEEAFIAGLTQNIGSLIFVRYFPERYGRLLKRYYLGGADLSGVEEKIWGIDHAKLGHEVFSQWKMPIILGKTILYHHAPETVPEEDTKLKKLVTLAYLSDIASHVLYDENKGANLHKLKEEYKTMLQLEEDEIDEIMEHITKETETVAKDFDFNIHGPADYAQILQNANLELARINLDYEQMNRELVTEKKRAEKLTRELQKANKLLAKEVITDGLTKLYNHRFFYELINKEFATAHRHNQPLSCIMIDIDYFKQINDIYGHREGDTVLKSIGRKLMGSIREGDFAARYGGEEFAIILPNTNCKEAEIVAERIRKNVEDSALSEKMQKGDVTISAGVASFENRNVSKSGELVQLADKAVYMAKKAGRNRVITYNHPEASGQKK